MNSQKKEKILKIVPEGKDVIPYEMIINMQSFFITPEKDFWEKTEFYGGLKQSAVNDDDYENSKYLYHTLKTRHLGDLNDLYNVQDVTLLSEITENRFKTMHKTYGFNSRKCNSASAMSGYIEREMSKIILALLAKLDHVEIFEQTVTEGFSSVNTRVAFHTQILLPNLPKLKSNLDFENNPMSKDFDYKVVYNLKLGKNKTQKKIVISKILKLDENNQHGNGMTKPLPNGCIKDDSDISWVTFNFLMETVDFKDTIGHLYIVDIELDHENATEKMMAHNEIYPPIIEKHKIIDPCERSVFQLLEQYKEGERGTLGYKSTSKVHATMLKKNFLPMYLEELAFIFKRVGWKVTKFMRN